MHSVSSSQSVEAAISRLRYLDEWHFSHDTGCLFVVFGRGGGIDRLHAIVERHKQSAGAVRVLVLSRLPRRKDGTVDEEVLADLADAPRAVGGHFDPASRAPQDGDRRGAHTALVLSARENDRAGMSFAEPETLGEALASAAVRADKGVRFFGPEGNTFFSYRELENDAKRVCGGLKEAGTPPEIPIAAFTGHAPVFVRIAWGCFLRGNPLLPLARPKDAAAAGKLLAVLGALPEGCFLAGPQDQAFVDQLRDYAPHIIVRSASAVLDGPAVQPPRLDPEQTALLLLTSGSTAGPKLVMQTHAAILGYCSGASRANGFTGDDLSMNWFPLDHVGGLVMFHVRDTWLGCSQIQAATDWILAEPERWLDLMSQNRVTISWAPNFAYALLNARMRKRAPRNWDLSSLRVLINGGEMVVAEQAALFVESLKGAGLRAEAMTPAWGMSETCSGVTYSKNFASDRSDGRRDKVRVGRPIDGIKLRVVDADGSPLPAGSVGDLQIGGRTVTVGYWCNDAANDAAFSGDGWFRTGDIAAIEGDELVIHGRSAEKIIVNGVNFAAQDLEAAIAAVADVIPGTAAVTNLPGAGGDTDELAVIYSAAGGSDFSGIERNIRTALRDTFGLNAGRIVAVSESEIPRGPIGKILRPAVADLVRNRVNPAQATRGGLPDWFAKPCWRAKVLKDTGKEPGTLFFLARRDWVGKHILEEAQRRGYRVLTLDDYPPLGFGDGHFGVGYWKRLLGTRDFAPDAFVIVKDSAAPSALHGNVPATLRLISTFIGAWNSARKGKPCRLLVLEDAGAGGDPAPSPTAASTAAWLKSCDGELDWLDSTVLSLSGAQAEQGAAALFSELRSGERDAEILYDRGIRKVRARARYDIWTAPLTAAPVKRGGAYLLMGGLGGIGMEVARWLLRDHSARLLIVGRTDPAVNGKSGVRLGELQALGDVEYARCDVGEEGALERVVTAWEEHHEQRLDGAMHLAGVLSRGPIDEEQEARLEAAFRPKAVGLDALLAMRAGRENFTVISFSSLNGFFGGAGVAAHAAASAWQSAAAADAKGCLSISWSAWPGIGQGPGPDEMALSAQYGYRAIDAATGIRSLAAMMALGPGEWLVGIDNGTLGAADTPIRVLADELIGDGAISASSDPSSAPASYVPNAIADVLNAIWREELDLTEVGDDENFFDVGGTSLIVPRVAEEVRNRLRIEMPTVEIFKYPTLKTLSGRLAQIQAGNA